MIDTQFLQFHSLIEASRILIGQAKQMKLTEDWGDVMDELDIAHNHLEIALRMLSIGDEKE